MTKNHQVIKEYLENKGLLVLKSGWPDYYVINQEAKSGYMIEVKNEKEKLAKNQEVMHNWLRLIGVPVYVVRSVEEIEIIKGRSLLWALSRNCLKTQEEQVCFLADQDLITLTNQVTIKEIERLKMQLTYLQQTLSTAFFWTEKETVNNENRQG